MGGSIYFRTLQKHVNASTNDRELFEVIVNAPFHCRIQSTHLDLGIIVFLLVNPISGMIDRIALSNTEQAAGALKMSEKPFRDIKIPTDFDGNLIVHAIKSGRPQSTNDWKYLFAPDLSPRAARFNQAGAGVEYSCVYPLAARSGGALIFSYYQVGSNIGDRHRKFMEYYAALVDARLAQLGD